MELNLTVTVRSGQRRDEFNKIIVALTGGFDLTAGLYGRASGAVRSRRTARTGHDFVSVAPVLPGSSGRTVRD